jgi:hypothetical protein
MPSSEALNSSLPNPDTWTIREKIQSKLCLTMNIEDGLTFSRSLKPHVHTLYTENHPAIICNSSMMAILRANRSRLSFLPLLQCQSLHFPGIFYPWPCPLHKTTDSLHQLLTFSFPTRHDTTRHEHFFHSAYSSLTILKVVAANSSKTSVTNCRLTWHDIPEYFCHHEQEWESHVTQTSTSFKI